MNLRARISAAWTMLLTPGASYQTPTPGTTGETQKRLDTVRRLELFYLQELVEDPVDGTTFDGLVLDHMRDMRRAVYKMAAGKET